jgi:CLIP-associating protein 1/2
LALKVLKEILRHQPARFKNYAELTVMKTLEAHKDPHKEVSFLTVILLYYSHYFII